MTELDQAVFFKRVKNPYLSNTNLSSHVWFYPYTLSRCIYILILPKIPLHVNSSKCHVMFISSDRRPGQCCSFLCIYSSNTRKAFNPVSCTKASFFQQDLYISYLSIFLRKPFVSLHSLQHAASKNASREEFHWRILL